MKKVLLIVAILLSVFSASAGDKVLVLSQGNLSVLKSGGDATVSFDLEGATWDYKEPLSEHFDNLANLMTKAPAEFQAGFNDKAKKSYLLDSGDAKYKIVVKIDNMDSYFKVMGWEFMPGHVHKMWGTVTITDAASGDTVAVIKVVENKGGRDFTVDDSFLKCFKSLGEKIGSAFKSGKL